MEDAEKREKVALAATDTANTLKQIMQVDELKKQLGSMDKKLERFENGIAAILARLTPNPNP